MFFQSIMQSPQQLRVPRRHSPPPRTAFPSFLPPLANSPSPLNMLNPGLLLFTVCRTCLRGPRDPPDPCSPMDRRALEGQRCARAAVGYLDEAGYLFEEEGDGSGDWRWIYG